MTRKIKIIRCSGDWWYDKHIGETFIIEDYYRYNIENNKLDYVISSTDKNFKLNGVDPNDAIEITREMKLKRILKS